MLGKLTEIECLELLNRNMTGRLGCHADGTTYVVPVNYVFKEGVMYAHSSDNHDAKEPGGLL